MHDDGDSAKNPFHFIKISPAIIEGCRALGAAITGVKNALSKVQDALCSGEAVRLFGFKVAEEALARPDLNEDETRLLCESAVTFGENMQIIIESDGECSKEAALAAVWHALLIGLRSGADARTLNKLLVNAKTGFDRGRVAPANAARRKPGLDDLIARECESLWKKEPTLRSSSRRTAREILPAVNAAVLAMPVLERPWSPISLTNQIDARRYADRIRKRIESLPQR
jgi:hypothetical protein